MTDLKLISWIEAAPVGAIIKLLECRNAMIKVTEHVDGSGKYKEWLLFNTRLDYNQFYGSYNSREIDQLLKDAKGF